jgi:pSer/pThr/pTyr-binding forkhead associated (FHA) protein
MQNAKEDSIALTCPVCGLVNRPGELVCSRCGAVLNNAARTKRLASSDMPSTDALKFAAGEVILTDQEPITIEINGTEMVLPLVDMLTIGRNSDIQTDPMPDVDLSAFGAGDQGVSRYHLRIKRKNILIYVADLGSTNGTLLNGRRLIPNAERLLRNGDELQLGRLKMRIKF